MILDILGKIGFDWQVALANLINFLIIYLILRRFAFEPLKNVISERQYKIKTGLKDAQRAKEERISAEKKSQKIVEEARKEAHSATLEASKQSSEILDKAKADAVEAAAQIRLDAEKDIEKAEEKMREAFAAETGKLISQAVTKTLEENLSEEADKAIVKGMLQNLQKA